MARKAKPSTARSTAPDSTVKAQPRSESITVTPVDGYETIVQIRTADGILYGVRHPERERFYFCMPEADWVTMQRILDDVARIVPIHRETAIRSRLLDMAPPTTIEIPEAPSETQEEEA